jgi:SAM-dependent methyltransferase
MPQSHPLADERPAQDVQAYFERAASSFDRLYSENGHSPFMRWVNRHFRSDIADRYLTTINHVAQVHAGSVLDVGCGSGRYLAAFARLGVHRLVGIDLSQPMLDLARRQMTILRHGATDLICGDFQPHHFDEQFDVVVAMGFFDYQADPAAVLAKMRGLARQSVIASFPSRHWFRTPLRQLRYRLKNCPVHFFDYERIAVLAAQAGFTDVEIAKLPGAGMDFVSILRVGDQVRSVRASGRPTISQEALAASLSSDL